MIKDKIIQLPYVNQLTDTKDEFWKDKSCGICAIQMLIAFKNHDIMNISVMDLVKQCIELDGYVEHIGWKHYALVSLAKIYGVDSEYKKIFYGREETKEKGLEFIDVKLKKGEPVMTSIYFAFDPSRGGHLVVVNGYKGEGENIIGYHILDPYPNKRGSQYIVSREEFLRGWRGGLIWLKD